MTYGIPPRPDFWDFAACRGHDPNWWHPRKGNGNRDSNKAKAICNTCPVAATCLQWALDNDEQRGIWGGVSINEYRRNLGNPARRKRHLDKPDKPTKQLPQTWTEIEHGTYSGYKKERRRGIPICDQCHQAYRDYDNERRRKRKAA